MTPTLMNKLRFLRVIIIFSFAPFDACNASELTKFKVTNWKGCPESKLRYLALPQVSLAECAHECKMRPICRSVGYRRLSHLCEIFSTENEIVLKTPGRPPCVFIHRNDIKKDNKLLCNCPEGKVCNILTGACTVEECSPYGVTNDVTNGEICGNQNHIGAKVEIACGVGWESSNSQAVCRSDGNWSLELECIRSKCPVDNSWVHKEDMPNFKLQFHTETLPHSSAKAECENSNARLVRIDNEDKREYVRDILTTCEGLGNRNYWTDGSNTHAAHPGDYRMRFSNGDEMPLDEGHWQHDRPYKYYSKSQVCARMENYLAFRWRDAYCIESNQFICELPHG